MSEYYRIWLHSTIFNLEENHDINKLMDILIYDNYQKSMITSEKLKNMKNIIRK